MTRSAIKTGVRVCFRILVLPVYGLMLALSLAGRPDAAFQGCSQTLSLIPGKVGCYVRAAFYSLVCPGTSDEVSIGFMTLLSHRDTTIERGVYIGPQSNIGKCTIRANTLLGSGVHVLSGRNQHDFSSLGKPIQDQGGHYEKVMIGEDCWIGNAGIVMADVGSQSIVAAGSVVTQPLPEKVIAAGQPARIVRDR